ncbi:MAG: NADH-quinone oxidoreductase subunit C [Dehalococcoidia bacterium]|nr:NADH-quinone oxidoreductase subunit C [Dehalococcoidia bacterium]
MTRLVAGGDLAHRLQDAFPGTVESWDDAWVWVQPGRLVELCRWLRETPDLAFDFLSSISAVDYIEHFELVYHLTSIRHNHRAVVKARVYGRERPTAPSVVSVWRGANLQEREIWDLMGVAFEGHPNMKRIMLWEGFPGHPHRKDHLGG